MKSCLISENDKCHQKNIMSGLYYCQKGMYIQGTCNNLLTVKLKEETAFRINL
jgi:hypothetical protein